MPRWVLAAEPVRTRHGVREAAGSVALPRGWGGANGPDDAAPRGWASFGAHFSAQLLPARRRRLWRRQGRLGLQPGAVGAARGLAWRLAAGV